LFTSTPELIDADTSVDLIAACVFSLFLYVCWLRFLVCVHLNMLDRRRYFEPETGGPWVRPRPAYGEDLSQR
jgi:hypothetical protein